VGKSGGLEKGRLASTGIGDAANGRAMRERPLKNKIFKGREWSSSLTSYGTKGVIPP